MTQNKHSNACLVLLQAKNNFGAVHIVLDRFKKIFNLEMVQNVKLCLTRLKLKTYFGPILEKQGTTVSIFTSAHPIHYSPNRNILSKNYDAFFFALKEYD